MIVSNSEFFFWVVILAIISGFLIQYHWKRRWLYYYSWKIPGPVSWPLIGNAYCLWGNPKELIEKLLNIAFAFPPVFKLWVGQDLVIFNSKLEDVDFILNNHFEKGNMYTRSLKDLFKTSLLVETFSSWKKHRKVINPTFSLQNINSFSKIFDKHSRILVTNLEEMCGKDFDVLEVFWQTTFDIACETMLDIDSDLIENRHSFISKLSQIEEIITQRFSNPWLYVDTFWNLTSNSKKLKSLISQNFDYIQSIIDKKMSTPETDLAHKKRFLNHLLSSEDMTEEDILEQTHAIVIGASQTIATTLAFAMLIMGLFPKIQEEAYNELDSIFGESDRNTNPEDLNRMEYLEAFLKETMRIFPVGHMALRQLEKDCCTESYVFPKGATIAVFITHIHRNPKFWEDPETFNPERFLKENSHKIIRGSYLPFSIGARNCIGFKYGLVAMKYLLSNLLRQYKVGPVDYASLSDIKISFELIIKANKHFRVKLQRRNNVS